MRNTQPARPWIWRPAVGRFPERARARGGWARHCDNEYRGWPRNLFDW